MYRFGFKLGVSAIEDGIKRRSLVEIYRVLGSKVWGKAGRLYVHMYV